MLKFYTVVANRFYGMRAVIWLLTISGVGGFGATLFFSRGGADEAYMLFFTVLLLWSLCLLIVVYTFIKPLPVIKEGERFLTRMKKRLVLGVRWAMAWTLTLLCLGIVYVSLRVGGIALRSIGA